MDVDAAVLDRSRSPARHPGRRAQRRRRRPARGFASHRQPADPASRRDLVRARRDHTAALYDPKVPHHDIDDEAEMCHLNVEYWPTSTAVQLTARGAGACSYAARRTASTAAWRYALDDDARTTDRLSLPRATVPRGERRHVLRPPAARRLRHPSPSCGASKPSSPAARPAGGACATPGSGSSDPHDRRSDDAAGRGPRCATVRTPPQHRRASVLCLKSVRSSA